MLKLVSRLSLLNPTPKHIDPDAYAHVPDALKPKRPPSRGGVSTTVLTVETTGSLNHGFGLQKAELLGSTWTCKHFVYFAVSSKQSHKGLCNQMTNMRMREIGCDLLAVGMAALKSL